MKPIDYAKKSKHFQTAIRPSQSLHCRFLKSNPRDISKNYQPRPHDPITMCIIYKKKKIQFSVKHKETFSELNKLLYTNLQRYLLNQLQLSNEKIEKVLKNIVGFESVDGDINFDYRLSLENGFVEKTKFFYPFVNKSSKNDHIKYKMYNCLAIGGFSKVYLARSYENGEFYAIKFIKKSFQNDLQERDKYDSLKNQMRVAQELEHPFLVKLLQAFETTNFYCMVFQYCPGGELFYLLKKVKIMSEEMAKFYFLQILYGIQYLHSKNIIYRDLKPENILIDSDGNCKIVDFGLSKQIDSRNKTFSYCGSAQYMAPEMILRTGHSFGIDYYSLGALLYQLVTGLPPYYTKNHDELQQSIICKQISFPQHIELSIQIKDLLQKLLKKEEKHRLGSYVGIKEIIFHPWIGKINSSVILGKQSECPYVPNLQDYNFDTSELGEDEQQFTALVYEDINKESNKWGYSYKQFYKSSVLSNYSNKIVEQLIIQAQESKENDEQNSRGLLSKLKQNKSNSKLKEIVRSHNILQLLEKNGSKQKSIRNHNTVEERRSKQVCKLYPYLNCKQASPRKQKQILNFLEHKIMKIQRPQAGKKLKRMRVERNKFETEKIQ